ncbi:MAG: TonB-dependent receptor, partial [Myxococcaceae bacterium]|nr:TonB-dependent receptor [Myxococcaceae bacterium]
FTEQNRDFLHGRLQSTGLGAFQKVSLELSAHRQGDVTDRFRVGRDRLERDAVDVWTYGLRAEAEAPRLAVLPGAPTPLFGAELFHDRVGGTGSERRPLSGGGDFSPVPEDARYPGTPTSLAAGVFGLLASDEREAFSYHAGARLQLNRTRLPEDSRLHDTFADSALPPPVLPAATVDAMGVAAEVGVRHNVLPGLSLMLNLGSGFRAPNVDDYLRMGTEGIGFLIPNRSLRPEQSYTAEVGGRLALEAVQAQLFYAYTVIAGLVGNNLAALDGETHTPDGLPYLTRQNREVARIHSLEAAASVRVLPSLTLSGHATWTHTRQRRADLTQPGVPFVTEPLARTPPLNGLLRATWEPTDTVFAEAGLRWALAQEELSAYDREDPRICSEAPGCTGTPGWSAVQLRGGWRISRHFSAALTLQNLLDATYRSHGSGVDEPGRSAILSLEASL